MCGIEQAPRKVTRGMNKVTIKRKTKVKPFIKAINYTHILPTRYVRRPVVRVLKPVSFVSLSNTTRPRIADTFVPHRPITTATPSTST